MEKFLTHNQLKTRVKIEKANCCLGFEHEASMSINFSAVFPPPLAFHKENSQILFFIPSTIYGMYHVNVHSRESNDSGDCVCISIFPSEVSECNWRRRVQESFSGDAARANRAAQG